MCMNVKERRGKSKRKGSNLVTQSLVYKSYTDLNKKLHMYLVSKKQIWLWGKISDHSVFLVQYFNT